ncbi:ribonuclease H-like domain-containing protein [Tanacetum coccineum]
MSQPANDEFSQHLSDDEESNHEDASDTGAAPKQQQQVIPQTTAISNIKLPILKKEEYDIWAMEMEHYLEYIDNEVWKVIQNGNSKKRISTGKDGIVRILSPVTAAEIQAVEKERKAKNILLMAIPKEHMRRFHGMDDAKEIWEAIRTRFGGNANSKKMQKAVFKQQFEAFKISNSEGLEKGYDRFQQLLSQLEAHGAEVSTEDANHKFLRSLPPAWSNLAMTMRTNPEIDTLSIDDLYNNLRVFEQEIQGASKTSSSAQNVAFVSQSKSSTNKVKSGFTGAYSTCTPSTSSTNIPEKEVLAGFADEVIYSLFAKQSEDWDLLHEDLEQIDDVDIEEMDINWQIAMIAIRMKKFYKKTGRRVRVDGKTPVGFDKKKLECFNCHNTGHFARECTAKGTHDGKKKRDSFYQHQEAGKQEKNQMGLLTMDDGIANEIYEKDEKLKRYRRIGMKAVKEKEQLQKTLDSWKDSSKNLWRLIDSGMSSNSKVGLGFEIQSNNEVLSYEEEMYFSVFNCSKEDSSGKPLYSRFTKTNDFKGVPHPLSGDYTPKPQEEIDDSLYGLDSEELVENTSEHSFETESESLSEPNEMSKSRLEVTNEKDVSAPKSKEKIVTIRKRKWQGRAEVKGLLILVLRWKNQSGPKANVFNHLNKFVPRSVQLNTVGFLRKPDESAGFAEIVDFLRGSNLRYALTSNPTIYDSLVKQFWQTATINTIADGTLEIRATIDTIGYTITEASIRDTLQLADATGITMLPNDEIFEGMGQMGYPTDGTFTFWKSFFTPQWRYLVHHLLHCISSKSGGWDQFGSNIATALICLSTDRVYNFSKLIFDGMVANLKSKTKFLMYPRFLQMILNIQTENKHLYLAVTLTKKIFGNMKRGFRGAPRPLLPAMLLVASTNPNAGQEHHAVTQTQPSSSTLPVPSTSSPPVQSPPPIPASIPTPTPIPETEPAPFEHTFEEPSPVHKHFSPPQEQAHEQMTMDDLLQTLKRKNLWLKKIAEALQDDSWVQAMQDELNKRDERGVVMRNKAIYKRRKETKGKKVVTSLDFQEEVDTGAKGVNTGSIKVSTVSEQVSTGSTKRSIPSPDKGQREGKAPMIIEEAPKKSKEQILQEEASLAEAIRLDTLQKEEVAKQVHLDSLLAQRIAEEEELNEQQKKRRAQVQFEAQHYTDEDWDLIRAKIEANAELSKSMLGSDLQGEDFAKKMVDLVNQRKKYFAEERARAKRNKPMTQSQLKTYMMNYLKNQGTWKLSQLKNLSFEEVKEEFDKLVKQVESFAPINFEATKASLKRFGEELQTKTTKRLKDDEAKDAEPAKKSGKRRKQMARKGLHTDLDKDDSEGSDEVSEQDDSVSGTKIPINPVPVAMKSPSIATYKIIKQGEKGVYQIVREDGTDIVYINFGAMLKDISRDDLTELYRIVMNRYGMDGPEDELEKVFWKYLKNMFEEPLSTDPIWSLLGQQRVISWRYYDTCRVHCLNLESMDIYMLIERKYPLSAEICKTMLNKKLQGGKPDEDCYKMLKMMEKQAGIRK